MGKKAKRANKGASSNASPMKMNGHVNRKSPSWSLPPFVMLLGVGLLAHLIWLYTNGPRSNPSKARKLREQAMLLVQRNSLLEGLTLLDEAIEADMYSPHGYNSKAGVLRMLGRSHEALGVLLGGDKIVTERYGEDYEDLWSIKQGLFFVYNDAGEYDLALQSIQRATELHPNPSMYVTWAGVDEKVLNYTEKVKLYDKALELEPNHIQAFSLRHHAYAILGEWDKLSSQHEKQEEYLQECLKLTKRTDGSCLQPYHLSYMNFSAEMMRETIKVWAGRQGRVAQGQVLPPLQPSEVEPLFDNDGKQLRKLRVGYVSSDLNSKHPVGRNVLGLLLAHDKNKFDIYCFATMHSTNDPIIGLIEETVTYVNLPVLNLPHVDVAKKIRNEYRIDVLIDLNGWTSGRRLQVFAAKPAPVQITHGLGYVGTTGIDAFQYFISDKVASPERFDEMYTENLVRLPHAYLPASHSGVHLTELKDKYDPASADKMELRSKNGLPEDANTFVFCSFQSHHKISPDAFDAWMRILQKSPNSVLWMTTIKKEGQAKLLQWAQEKHQIGPERFVFGEGQQINHHLMRAQACDLHLDSWPYNAHSTGADVLWASVPLLVYLPDYHDAENGTAVPKMCARVSASLLDTLGMPQLITSTIEQFVHEGVRLSTDQEAYDALRNELLTKRRSSPLYDLVSYARHHEAAYLELYNRFLKGLEPTPLDVPEITN